MLMQTADGIEGDSVRNKYYLLFLEAETFLYVVVMDFVCLIGTTIRYGSWRLPLTVNSD